MKHAALVATGLSLLAFVAAGYGAETILKEAIVHNNLAAVSNFVQSGMNINASEGDIGQTALHIAAAGNRLAIAELLIAAHADVNARDFLGLTPLHLAAYNNHLDMAELLLKQKVEINAADVHGLTPLHLAAQYGHEAMIRLLLNAGADLNARTYDRGMTPIHWAAFWGHTEGLNALLAHGADINARDSTGDTPLTWAEGFIHYDMARLIARKGGKRHMN